MNFGIEVCPLCSRSFKYNQNLDSLKVDLNNTDGIYKDYPLRDDVWESRRWNMDKTQSIDLSGGVVICQDCYDKRKDTDDVNVDGHVICKMKGCANDANESGKYCNRCNELMYGKPETEKPFKGFNHGKGLVDLRKHGKMQMMMPIEIHLKEDGSFKNEPTLTMVMIQLDTTPVCGEISLEMLNDGLNDIGYEIVRKNN